MSIKFYFNSLFLTVLLISSSLADWKSDANARIEQIRKRNAKITVLGASGQFVSDVNVEIEQVNHKYKFGTALNYNSTNSNAIYRDFVLDHFNYAVCENESKWPANEGTRDVENYTQADAIYNFCNTNGIPMRGHCLFWEQTTMVPSWAQTLGCAALDQQGEINERIDQGIAHFADKFEQWDIDNEMLSNDFYSCIGNQGRANMFIRANQVDPDCKLFMNEYNGNSFGGFDANPYITRYNQLIALGAVIHGIGIQGHVSGGFGDAQALQYWNDVLKPLGTLGLPILATEFDTDTTSDATRATDLENYFRIMYSDPNTEGIIMWGFMVGTTWRANGAWGIVSSSGVLNAAGQKYEQLMDEWTTEDSNYTDAQGVTGFRGFQGTYEITLTKAGQTPEVHIIDLEQGSTLQEFTINTNFTGGAPETNAPTPNPMTWATAPAAAGPYSITMTATTATDNESPPVQYYFECTNHDDANSSWQSSPIYAPTGLTPSTSYSFRVKARDSASSHNETGWSSTESATTNPPDTTPPTPNPMTWAAAPTAISSTSITMTASTATDSVSPPVEYYFECTNDDTKSSTWQSSPTYTAGSLTPMTLYSFRVKARDSAPSLNETGYSGILSATTPAPPTDVNIVGSWTAGTSHAEESGYNRALILIAHAEHSSGTVTLNSVTYGGQPMTKIVDAAIGTSYSVNVTAFILNEAGIEAATSDTFSPSWSTTPGAVTYTSVFVQNVNQTTLIGATDSATTTSSNPIVTDPLSTSEGDMVFDAATSNNLGSYTLTGFTEGFDQQFGNSTTGGTGAAGYKAATGAAVTPSATYSASIGRQAIIGFVLNHSLPVDYPPAAPANLTAAAGYKKVTLDWDNNTETDLAGYNVYRSTTSGSDYSLLNSSLLSDSNYIDNNVVNGTTYYYAVKAADAGNNLSEYSNEVDATPDYQTCADIQDGNSIMAADLNKDCRVNYEDLKMLAENWLTTGCVEPDYCNGADFVPRDGTVNLIDFSGFAESWMMCNDPQDAACQ